MNPLTVIAILELIHKGLAIGGEILPIALRAYAALRSEGGLTDDELGTLSLQLNDVDITKLRTLLAEN